MRSRVGLALVALRTLAAQPLAPEHAIQVRQIEELSFSPNGDYLICTVFEPPKGAERHSHLWILNVSSGEFRQFTFSGKSERGPRWSPDGRAVAFFSDRDERNQIYIIPRDGGEARPVTSGKNTISFFRWSPDGKTIAFLAPEPKSEEAEKKEKDKDDPKVPDREKDLARLWIIGADGKNLHQLTRGL